MSTGNLFGVKHLAIYHVFLGLWDWPVAVLEPSCGKFTYLGAHLNSYKNGILFLDNENYCRVCVGVENVVINRWPVSLKPFCTIGVWYCLYRLNISLRTKSNKAALMRSMSLLTVMLFSFGNHRSKSLILAATPGTTSS